MSWRAGGVDGAGWLVAWCGFTLSVSPENVGNIRCRKRNISRGKLHARLTRHDCGENSLPGLFTLKEKHGGWQLSGVACGLF